MIERKLTICLDFDGVIHSYNSGWKGVDVIPDEPVKHAIQALRVYTGYFKVCIYSSRSKDPAGVRAMQNWLLDWGLEPEYLSHIDFPYAKPAAFLTIDDRCWLFEGHFPTPKEIKAFKPWNKK